MEVDISANGIIICANRGPVSFVPSAQGAHRWRTGPNGLVAVVLPALRAFGGSWIFAAETAADRRVAESLRRGFPLPLLEDGVALHPVAVPPDAYREYYEEFAVGLLGMLFHYLFPMPGVLRDGLDLNKSWPAYRKVNEIFARQIVETHRDSPVLVQDYHLLLVADEVRRLDSGFGQPLIYFHHVAWCQSDYFGMIPSSLRSHILRAMTSYDVVAFHSSRWADSFMACCDRYLDGVICEPGVIRHDRGETRVAISPAAIDRDHVLEGARHPEFQVWQQKLRVMAGGRWTLGRVERADLWKNPLRGLLAVDEFLRTTPDAEGRAWFPVLLSPTRTWRSDYRSYLTQVQDTADRINATHEGIQGGRPVEIFTAEGTFESDRALALAIMSVADAMIANPAFDGLNLIPKEAAIVAEGDPVVIVSENAGVYDELAGIALKVNPFDVGDTARALRTAFRMPPEERRRRADALRARVSSRTSRMWIEEQLSPTRTSTA
ncbi:trehalose-6-phosphate synthase [Lentzea sp. BCCO 10_0856]|uniref:Trehalose-6-phosphate synthase n=1 Tax=Lentzea miocenica TaxID=3095431 RepID=A0ABU4T785_9PSEU|nr:trehalose-6-phosphate synthase [Lentzea sp. BCCO 10_0856]MDX8034035.1 trehalose-6-phosphate synthase [Lentzea sp. BCCO 10_0856]